jgi:hypothetical protein
MIKKRNYTKLLFIVLSIIFLSAGIYILQFSRFAADWGVLFHSDSNEAVVSDEVVIEKQIKGMLVQAKSGDVLWTSKGITLYKSNDGGKSWEKKGTLPYSWRSSQYYSRFSIVRRIFARKGILEILVLKSGTLLVHGSNGNHIWRSDDDGMTFDKVHHMRYRFLEQGWTEKDGVVYYGEYDFNGQRQEMNIVKGIDDGRKWEVAYSFKPGDSAVIYG